MLTRKYYELYQLKPFILISYKLHAQTGKQQQISTGSIGFKILKSKGILNGRCFKSHIIKTKNRRNAK